MVKTIKLTRHTNYINVLSYGTIVYMKGKDNVVRECKVVGFKAQEDLSLRYEFKVAGIKEHIFGTMTQTDMGAIYPTKEIAKHAPAEYNYSYVGDGGWEKTFTRFFVLDYLANEYACGKNNYYFGGTWGDVLCVRGVKLKEDGTTPYVDLGIEFYMDKLGIHVLLPQLDNKTFFIHPENARYHSQIKVVTFDDEDDEDDEELNGEIEIKVSVTFSQFVQLKELGVEIVEM